MVSTLYEWSQDQSRLGLPSTARTNANIMNIHELIFENRHQTIDYLVDMTGVSWFSCQWILNFQQTKVVTVKFVPRLPTEYQKQLWLNACRKLNKIAGKRSRSFSMIITADQSLFYVICRCRKGEEKKKTTEVLMASLRKSSASNPASNSGKPLDQTYWFKWRIQWRW